MHKMWKLIAIDSAVVAVASLATAVGLLPPLPTLPVTFAALIVCDLVWLRSRSARRGTMRGTLPSSAGPPWRAYALLAAAAIYLAGACVGLHRASAAGWPWDYCLGIGVSLAVVALCLRAFARLRRRNARE